jgi:hypothetical protein
MVEATEASSCKEIVPLPASQAVYTDSGKTTSKAMSSATSTNTGTSPASLQGMLVRRARAVARTSFNFQQAARERPTISFSLWGFKNSASNMNRGDVVVNPSPTHQRR